MIGPAFPTTPLPSSFFARPADIVGAELVGKILWREGVGGGRLTEVEAYLPVGDPASHASRGPTRRNRSMFGCAGTLYVYLSYGIHVLLNLVCDEVGVGAAVLVRSFEPLGDTSVLRVNRGFESATANRRLPASSIGRSLTCGPGRVGQALGLTLDLDGLSLGSESGVYILDDGRAQPAVERRTRVGISRGDHLPLRFIAAGSGCVTGRRKDGGVRAHETK